MRKCEDWITSWKQYREDVAESPKIYNEWVAVSMLAAVIQRKAYLPWDSRIYPNFYIVLVGPAGEARKGTAMSPGNEMLRELGIKMTAESTTREALIRHLKVSSATFTGDDNTMHMFSALTVYSEEFTTFIGYNNRQLMADLANWWDCPSIWKYDTKNKGTDKIDGVYLNLIGGTTPEIFRRALPEDAVGGGLLSRTICVYADRRSQYVIFPSFGSEQLRRDLFNDLEVISSTNGSFSYDDSFRFAYADWYPKQHEEVGFNDERLAAYVARRSTHLRKLCMIMNASRNGNNIITAEDFDRAKDLLKRTEEDMPKTFLGVGQGERAEITSRVLSFIAMRGEVTYAEVLRRFLSDIDDEKMPLVITSLEKSNLVEKVYHQTAEGIMSTQFTLRLTKEKL